MTTPISPCSFEEVTAANAYIADLDLKAKERLCDEIAVAQPIMLAHVLPPVLEVTSYERLDHIIHILLVLYRVFVHVPQKTLRQITEEDMEGVLRNNVAMFKLLELESPDERNHITYVSIAGHPEVFVLMFVIEYLRDHGFVQPNSGEQYYVLAAKNILDCFVKLKYEAQGQTKERPVV